jgi:hypothetical protein
LYCLSVFYLRLPITTLVSSNFSFGHCVVCSFLIYEFWLLIWYLNTLLTCHSIHLNILWALCKLLSFGHCVVCPSSFYGFWLLLWYLNTLLACHSIHLNYLLLYKLPKIFTTWWKSLFHTKIKSLIGLV